MRLHEILSEAAMSIGLQAKHPISAGARGLMGARFRYDKAIESNVKDIDKSAVDQLEHNLRHVPKIDYDHIDILMKHICEKFRVQPAKLHKDFVQKFNCTPDVYAVQYKKSREGQPAKI
jgi:ribosomal protein S18